MGKVETQETQIRHNDKGEANLNKVHTGQETNQNKTGNTLTETLTHKLDKETGETRVNTGTRLTKYRRLDN